MFDLVDVQCMDQFDPPIIVINIAGDLPIYVSKPLYEMIRQPLGLPDVVCGEG